MAVPLVPGAALGVFLFVLLSSCLQSLVLIELADGCHGAGLACLHLGCWLL